MQTWYTALTPNALVPSQTRNMIIFGWIVLLVLFWQFGHIPFLPSLGEVAAKYHELWAQGVVYELFSSIGTMIEAVIWTVVISLTLAYLSVVPVFRPLANGVAALRYLSLTGLMLAFTLLTRDAHALKIMVLTYGITVFFLKDMVRVVRDIPQERYNHARTLGMGPWPVVWEVVVRGTLATAFDSLRVNAAMGWMMLPMIEGLVRSEGGIGVVLINVNRHLDLSAIVAIITLILLAGMAQDFVLDSIKNWACPYARLGKARS